MEVSPSRLQRPGKAHLLRDVKACSFGLESYRWYQIMIGGRVRRNRIVSRMDGYGYICLPFNLSRNKDEHLKVTTLLAPNMRSLPVAGFLPRRSFFSRTQNFPKPLIRTSSPSASVFLMISNTDSIRSADWDLVRSKCFCTDFMIWSFVRVMAQYSRAFIFSQGVSSDPNRKLLRPLYFVKEIQKLHLFLSNMIINLCYYYTI